MTLKPSLNWLLAFVPVTILLEKSHAAPPSEMRLQSSIRNGEEIIAEAWCSSSVIGVRLWAFSFNDAW